MIRKKVLFLCVHNASRSIMAEALVNHFLQDKWEAYSAGSDPTGVNPYSIKALKEIGIDIANAHSKAIDYFQGRQFDKVITLCDEAAEACPLWLGPNVEHISFRDPSTAQGSDLEKLAVFREVRDRIRETIMPRLSE